MAVQLFEVGGSIRDELMGISNSDRDFVAVCPGGWPELLTWAENELDKVFLITPEFFTIRGIKGKEVFDIVMARKEDAYSDGRHPDKVEPGSLIEDLARRDFTMNAIARPVDGGELIDPHNGVKDIENGLIRCVGCAEDRFKEDSLRVLRALRFLMTKFGMYLEKSIVIILRTNRITNSGEKVSDLLSSVSRDRVREELHKMFKHDTLLAAGILFDGRLVHADLRKAILGDDIWLKPTTEKIKDKRKKKVKPGLNSTGKTRPLSALKSEAAWDFTPAPDPLEVANLAEYHTRSMLQEEFDAAKEQHEEKAK